METQLGEVQYRALMNFCNFINALQVSAERGAAGDVLQELLQGDHYETYLFDTEDAKPAQTK